MDSAMEDIWLRKATTAAIAAARKVIEDGAVNPAAPVGRLSDVELGWIFSSSLFAWIVLGVLFVLATQFLGLYVASFLLIAGFMRTVGKIALWKSLLTALVFTAIMFATFDIAFDVIMPKGPLEAAFGY